MPTTIYRANQESTNISFSAGWSRPFSLISGEAVPTNPALFTVSSVNILYSQLRSGDNVGPSTSSKYVRVYRSSGGILVQSNLLDRFDKQENTIFNNLSTQATNIASDAWAGFNSLYIIGTNYTGSIRAGSNVTVTINWTYNFTACTPPVALSLSATLSEGATTLSGSGASSGVSNTITGYEIHYQDSANGANWGAWLGYNIASTSAGSFSTSVWPPDVRGSYRRFRARTIGSAGEAYYSGWVESGSVRKNRVPSPPASISASPSIYESGNITISWPSGSDPDGGTLTYNLYYAYEGATNWTYFGATTSLSAVFTPSMNRGSWVYFRIEVYDSFGVVVGGPTSNLVYRNRAPNVPTIITKGTTYNPSPYFIFTSGSDPDGQAQTFKLSIDGGAVTQITSPYKIPAMSVGNHTLSLYSTDSLGANSSTVSVTINVSSIAFTDTPLVAGITNIKAVHMNEIRNAINIIRSYYGLGAISWSQSITANTTNTSSWGTHVDEIRNAINNTIARYSGTAKSWTNDPNKRPTVVAMQELRNAITSI